MNKNRITWQLKLLRTFCKQEYLEEIEGDLLERLEKRPSQWLLTLEVLKLIRPRIIKNFEGSNKLNYYGKFKNQLTASVRAIKRERVYTIMNVTGLSVAIACCLFIYLWLTDELQYNTHLEDGDRVCNVLNKEVQTNGVINTYRYSPFPLKAVLDAKYPIIESSTVLSNGNWMAFQIGEEIIEWAGIDATPEVFELFEVDFLKGSVDKMYDNANALAISKRVAEVYFGKDWEKKNVIGSFMENDEGEVFELAGVYKNLPKHSTVDFEFVVPFANRVKKRPNLKSWKNSSSQLFVKLKSGIEIAQANSVLQEAINQHRVGEFQNTREIFLQSFKDMYLYNRYENGTITGGRIDYIHLLSVTAILVLLLASINFMNLTTARTTKRAKETGVRKVLGASKRDIRIQFQLESILMTLVSAVIALAIVFYLLPDFQQLTNKDFDSTRLFKDVAYLIGVFVFIHGVFTGFYPSYLLSSLKSTSLLKSGNILPQSQNGFRKALVIFQFTITLVMIVGSLTVYQQVIYIQNKNIGLDRSGLIRTYSYDMDPVADYHSYKADLLNRSGIESVTLVNQLLIDIRHATSGVSWEGKQDTDELEFYHMDANPDFIPTMKIELRDGRNFDWEIQSDTDNYVINEAAQQLMGLTEPIGKTVTFWDQKGKIVGVVKDFHNASLHSAIKPLIIRNQMRASWMIVARSKPGMNQEALASLENTFLEYNPNRVFWYQFMDDLYNSKYKSELLVQKLSWYFTVVSVAISLLGLISLVAYSTERRTKEIGIRKILGATALNILRLLSFGYISMLAPAIVIAFPVSYFILSGWLEGYAYRINLNWWTYVFASSCILILAMIIVGLQTKRVATSNPVESLKDE